MTSLDEWTLGLAPDMDLVDVGVCLTPDRIVDVRAYNHAARLAVHRERERAREVKTAEARSLARRQLMRLHEQRRYHLDMLRKVCTLLGREKKPGRKRELMERRRELIDSALRDVRRAIDLWRVRYAEAGEGKVRFVV